MTSVLEGAKKLVGRSSDIGTRLTGLEQAVTASRGRVDEHVVDDVDVRHVRREPPQLEDAVRHRAHERTLTRAGALRRFG